MWEEIEQFVAEDRDATWFKSNNRNTIGDFLLQSCHDLFQQVLRKIQYAVVIKGASAADILLWHLDMKTRSFKHLNSRDGGCRMEMVIEGVGPENNSGTVNIFRFALEEP